VTLLNRPSVDIAFSIEALKTNLSRLEDEWETYQATRDRDGIYGYLAAVFELVMWWKHEHKAIEYAHRALSIQRRQSVPEIAEPFAAVIFCTADPEKVDYLCRLRRRANRVAHLLIPPLRLIKSRSGSSRSLYAAAYRNTRDHLLRIR
jgi:hypothetical protein